MLKKKSSLELARDTNNGRQISHTFKETSKNFRKRKVTFFAEQEKIIISFDLKKADLVIKFKVFNPKM